MKRLFLATTSLVVAGGMAAADVSVTGSAELGVSGEKGKDAKLHRDIRVKFGLSGATDTGLTFGASAALKDAGKYQPGGSAGAVHVSGAFGTLTLGDTDGAFDKALTEVGAATSIADNHTGHPGYDGNSGLDGFAENGGSILRYDYAMGGLTTSVSANFNGTDASDSVYGAGVAWSGDMGGIGFGVGIGFQTGKFDDKVRRDDDDDQIMLNADGTAGDGTDDVGASDDHKASIIGASVSADLGNGLSVVANFSSKKHDTTLNTFDDDLDSPAAANHVVNAKITSASVGIAYTVGDLTIGVNGGSITTKENSATGFMLVDGVATDIDTAVTGAHSRTSKSTGAGVGVTYGLGTGVTFQVGVGSGKEGTTKKSSWSAGLAFSF